MRGSPLETGFETILGLYGSIFEPCLGGPGNAWMSSINRLNKDFGLGFEQVWGHLGGSPGNWFWGFSVPHRCPGRKSTSDPWIFSLCSFCELYSAGTIFGPSWGPPQAGRDGPGPLRLCFRTLFGGSWTCLDVFNKEHPIRILVRFQTGMAQLGGFP